MMMQISNQALAQFPTTSVSNNKSVGEPETHIIPSLSIAERYDSNIFFVPGKNLEDYVTTVSPQLRLNHRSRWIDGVVRGGPIGAFYAKNSGLNYVGGNGTVDLNLDGAMNRLVQGLGLRIVDSIYYAPQLSAYGAPSNAGQGNETFVRGLQAQRANAFRNTATVQGSYSLSEWISVTSTYTDQRLRFGKPIADSSESAQGRLIDTDFQTVASGPVINLTPSDTLSFVHLYQQGAFGIGGTQGSFSVQGASGKWSRLMTSALQATVEGGFVVISPSSSVQAVGAASLTWRSQYTTFMVSYSRSIMPSFLVVSSPLVSEIVTGTVQRKITDPLSLSVMGSYAINESVASSRLLRVESYAISSSINYAISKTFGATLSYTHSQFEQIVDSGTIPFDRNIVQLSLTAGWE
ncbi:MAG: outer membrane beta-barrel protein [Nitrospira sp.]|nr:outer membrane beta-barrel protein [Nitrospira sp.]